MTTDQRKNGFPWVVDIATTVTLLGALIYLTGWSYAYHYFGYFKLGLLAAEIPGRYFFMYGFWVLKAWWWLVALIYLPFALFTLWPRPLLEKAGKKQILLFKYLQIPVIVLGFTLAWWLAVKQAQHHYLEQQRQGFTSYPLVRIWPKPVNPGHENLHNLYRTLPEGEYRLLLQTREKLFLIKPPRDHKPARPAVLQLNPLDTSAIKILN